jgi:uncharacterized protein (TIGR03084 family)
MGRPGPGHGDVTIDGLAADLRAEHDALDGIVAELSPSQWATPTPSPGWSVADQIAHLTYFDGTAATAITQPEAFHVDNAELFAALTDGAAMEELTLAWSRGLDPSELLARWRANRSGLLDAAATLDERARVAWYGPSMGARSFLTARLMETWAHGQDIVDAVGASRRPTDRLRHVAQLGVITRSWSFVNRGLPAPGGRVLVELVAPSGDVWTWDDDATDGAVRGRAEDFCLVVTQRRHVDDTALRTEGDPARRWMELAQAFAGAATDGPSPMSHPKAPTGG